MKPLIFSTARRAVCLVSPFLALSLACCAVARAEPTLTPPARASDVDVAPGRVSFATRTVDPTASDKNKIIDTGNYGDEVVGSSASGDAVRNVLSMTGGQATSLTGGMTTSGNAADNVITVSGGRVVNEIRGGAAMRGDALENSIVIGSGVKVGNSGNTGFVFGGWTDDGNALGNSVRISGVVDQMVYGGYSSRGFAGQNYVAMEGGSTTTVMGGYCIQGDADGNSVEISGGDVTMSVLGGRSDSGSASGNSVEISGGVATAADGGVGATTADNRVVMSGGQVRGRLTGGSANTGPAEGNSIEISGGSVGSFAVPGSGAFGGVATNDTASMNTVAVSGGTVTGSVMGGSSYSGIAEKNSVILSGGTVTGIVTGGGTDNGSAINNTVSISGGTVHGNVNGGFVASDNGKATGNIVNISGKADLSGAVVAGGSSPDGDAFTDNTLNKNSDAAVHIARNFASVNFGYSGTANIGELDSTPTGSALSGVTVNTNANNVSFDGVISGSGSITKTGAGTLILSGTNTYSGGTTISAGILSIGSDTNIGSGTNTIGNKGTLLLSGNGTYTNDWTLSGAGSAIATDNNNTLSGVLSGNGGLTKTGTGTLTLSGTNTYTGMTTVRSGTLALGSDLTSNQLTLYGGTVFDRGSHNHSLDNGILSVNGANGQSAMYKGDLSARNATLNFISPVHPTQPLLRVTGDADVSGSACNVGLAGGTSLASGSTLTLLEVDPDKTLTANNLQRGNGIVQIGSTVAHDITADVNLDPTTRRLNAVTAQVSPGRATDQSKALSEGFLGGLALNLQGADLVAGRGMDSAVRASSGTDDAERHGFAGFGALSGGSLRYNTGSHLDMNSLSLLTGLAWGIDLAPGRLTLGAFFEYGNGSYDTHNSFTNAASVDGDGNAYYLGGGILARMDFVNIGPGRFYAEASGRAGKTHNEYDSSDLRDVAGRKADYDSSSPYYGLHFGTGYVWNINDAATLDLYGKYFWTRQQGDSVGLSTGEHLSFDDINSSRLRFGGRFAYILNEHVAPYIGAAWEHEFDGKARARTNGFDIDAPNLRGNTGIGELGLSLTPSADLPLTVDLGVQGYTGKREGVTGSLMVKWEF